MASDRICNFKNITWHDICVHSINFIYSKKQVLFDVDYIDSWNPPQGDEEYYNFSLIESSLIFHEVVGIKINVEIDDILQINSATQNKVTNDNYCEWYFEFHEGDISIFSKGFELIFRESPSNSNSQYLTNRKGYLL